jgi:hypothetical protein
MRLSLCRAIPGVSIPLSSPDSLPGGGIPASRRTGHIATCLLSPPQDSLKNNFTFQTQIHPAWLRCENSKYA